MDTERVAKEIVDACIKIHRALGPGLLESVYQSCLAYELSQRGCQVDCEVSLPVVYEEVKIDIGYRVDMMIDNTVLIENKTVEQLLPVHKAQLLTYLKLTHKHLGFLINWNVPLIKNGLHRIVLQYPEPTSSLKPIDKNFAP